MLNNPQEQTISTYKNNFDIYKKKTTNIVDKEFKDFIDLFCSFLKPSAFIIEIGSAQGRDAFYIRSKGFNIFCTDVIPQALEELRLNGFEADLYDFRNHPKNEWLNKFDGFFANAVLLHASQKEFEQSLNNVYKVLKDNGIFAFSLKVGEGEEISLEKMNSPRFFKYYSKEELLKILEKYPFEILSLKEILDNKWLHVILKKK